MDAQSLAYNALAAAAERSAKSFTRWNRRIGELNDGIGERERGNTQATRLGQRRNDAALSPRHHIMRSKGQRKRENGSLIV